MSKKGLKLIIPDKELKGLPELGKIRFNLNGRKPRGKNLYKKQLRRIRRMFV